MSGAVKMSVIVPSVIILSVTFLMLWWLSLCQVPFCLVLLWLVSLLSHFVWLCKVSFMSGVPLNCVIPLDVLLSDTFQLICWLSCVRILCHYSIRHFVEFSRMIMPSAIYAEWRIFIILPSVIIPIVVLTNVTAPVEWMENCLRLNESVWLPLAFTENRTN